MILRMSWTAIIFILAISLGARLSNSSLYAETNETQVRTARAATSTDKILKIKSEENQIFEMSKDFGSGERSADAIEAEITGRTGENAPIRWDAETIKGRFKLAQVLTHVHSLENNFQLLFTHTLPNGKRQEDTVTQYSSRINEADQKTIMGSIVFSQYVETKDQHPVFDDQTRAQYFFSLKSDALKNSFNLREPEGKYDISPAKSDSFNPLAILTGENGNFDEIGEYQYEIVAGQTEYIVNVIPRLTDAKTLTIQTDVRETSSLTTTSFILIYKQL